MVDPLILEKGLYGCGLANLPRPNNNLDQRLIFANATRQYIE